MQTFKKNPIVLTFVLLILSFLGFSLGSLVGKGIVHFHRAGLFVFWEKLESPVKFSQIVEATPNAVWALSSDGQIYYYWNTYCKSQETCKRWIETKDISKEGIEPYPSSSSKENSNCQGFSKQFTLQREPPGEIVQCNFTQFNNFAFGDISYYVVLADGSIWAWQYTDSLYNYLLIPWVSRFLGIGLGILFFILLLKRERDQTQRKLVLQAAKNIILNILVLIAFVIGGAFVGFIIGFGIDFLPSTGIFTSWELLKSPVKFSQIVDINTKMVVWAQTSDGKLYSWGSECYENYSETCKQWKETNAIPDNAHEGDPRPVSKSKNCTKSDGFPSREPPGKVIECAFALTFNGPGYSTITYALLDDGTIWYWLPPMGTDFPVISMMICPSLGIILGTIIGIIALTKRITKKKPLSLSTQ